MARQPADREDLLREATALVQRVELAIAGEAATLLIGFRRDGCGSIYIGADTAYHFNSAHLLRRAYRDEKLIKAERGRLVSLTRRRDAGQVQLVRHELTPEETLRLLDDAGQHLAALRGALADGHYHVVGQVPQGEDIVSRVRGWLDRVELKIAPSPHAR